MTISTNPKELFGVGTWEDITELFPILTSGSEKGYAWTRTDGLYN